MTEADRCRRLAEADLARAQTSELASVRQKHEHSASIWMARVALLERTGLNAMSAAS